MIQIPIEGFVIMLVSIGFLIGIIVGFIFSKM